MAGETVKTEAICLDIRPWSRTSHVVSWLTPTGKVATVVKGAVRAKSQFLGQYDLNYTCDIVYYARAKGELHALRECVPVEMREEMRGDYRKLALAGYMRRLVAELAPMGEECRAWYEELDGKLDYCASLTSGQETASPLSLLLWFELRALNCLDLSRISRNLIETPNGRHFRWKRGFLVRTKDVAYGCRVKQLNIWRMGREMRKIRSPPLTRQG